MYYQYIFQKYISYIVSENLLSTLTSRDIWSVSAAACITQPYAGGAGAPGAKMLDFVTDRCRPLNHVFFGPMGNRNVVYQTRPATCLDMFSIYDRVNLTEL